METWQDMSRNALGAAQTLLDGEHWRSSASRAYYAAYCAVAGKADAQNISYPHGRNNPSHEQINDLVLNNLGLPKNTRFALNKALRRLRKGRKDADYRPHAPLVRGDAVKLFRDAVFVLENTGVGLSDE